MDATEGKGSDDARINLTVRGSAIGAGPKTLGDELARLIDVPLRSIALRDWQPSWVDTHAWQDAHPHA